MKCPYCSHEETITYFEANMPNILSSCPEKMTGKIKSYPLKVNICPECLLGFNISKLGDDELKDIYDNYLYISPSEGIGKSKYQGMIATLKKHYLTTSKIVEVGCSEGYLLNLLRNEGYNNLLGIEPGPQAEQANELGLNIIRDYFGEDTFKGQMVDGFYLMHVFEHFSNPFKVLEAMKKQLSPAGKIIIEVPNFDGYHHQHLFFYNLNFMMRLCKEQGLKIIEAICENGALRVVIVHNEENQYEEIKFSDNFGELVNNAMEKYNKFKKNVLKLNNLLPKYYDKKLYWWGAGSLSVIYLNQLDITLLKKLEIIVVDGDKNKWGNYIPGLNIKVHPYAALRNSKVDCLIIASSFSNEIQEVMKNNNIIAELIEVVE